MKRLTARNRDACRLAITGALILLASLLVAVASPERPDDGEVLLLEYGTPHTGTLAHPTEGATP